MDPPRDSDESDFPAGLGAPARRALLAAGYHLIAQLDGVRESDIGQLHGIGRQALNLLRRALDDKGISHPDKTFDGDFVRKWPHVPTAVEGPRCR